MAEPIHCPECGNPLEKDHIICRKCGLLLPIKQREQAILAKLSEAGTGPGTPFPDPGSEIADDLLPAITVQMVGGESGAEAGQIAACEACAEAGAKSRGARCSVCSAWLCPGHTITCGVCKKTFCREHIHRSCSLCNDYVCPDCLLCCPVCNRVVGADHLLACDQCGQVNCEQCMSSTGVVIKKHYCKNRCDPAPKEELPACEECGELLPGSQGARCSVCGKMLCHDHTVPCSVCKKTFCREHIHRSCSLCDDYVCPDCLFRCPVCNGIVGADHLQECDHCGQVICKNCVSDVGILVKKKYCKNRCDLVTEEIRKQGLFRKLIDKIRMV
jgi:hypothetical protein